MAVVGSAVIAVDAALAAVAAVTVAVGASVVVVAGALVAAVAETVVDAVSVAAVEVASAAVAEVVTVADSEIKQRLDLRCFFGSPSSAWSWRCFLRLSFCCPAPQKRCGWVAR